MKQWQRARLAPPIPAALKVEPHDFVVDEAMAFEPAGSGEHALLRLEKINRTTAEVAEHLARIHRIAPLDVGYAGMKDKRAVTRQWFSLRGVESVSSTAIESAGLRVLDTNRHTRKLRRGEIAANRFQITLRDVASNERPTVKRLTDALDELKEQGAPNYFGGQRFGRDNLSVARRWLARRRRSRTSKFKQGLYLSVLRSYLFNEVLDGRVRSSNWRDPIAGDVLVNGLPSGPLWGRGRSSVSALAATIEEHALGPHGEIREGLEHAGLKQDRRALVLNAADFDWSVSADSLRLTFSLPAGGYATSFLAEVFDLQEPALAFGDPEQTSPAESAAPTEIDA